MIPSLSRLVLRRMSPAGSEARLSILLFHRVHESLDPMYPGEMAAGPFREVLQWMRQCFNVLPLDEAVVQLRQGTLPERAAAITFDDGYADNHQVALPLLEEARLSACFFIATDFLDGGRMWNDTLIESVRRCPDGNLVVGDLAPAYADLPPLPMGNWEQRRQAADELIRRTKYLPMAERSEVVERVRERSGAAMPQDLMMRSEQLRDLRARGMVVGAHTQHHPILARLSPEEARAEIHGGRRALQDLLGEAVELFAYPNGKPGEDYLPEHVSLVRELGFGAAVSTSAGAARRSTDPHQLPRFTPWDRRASRFLIRMMMNLRVS